jgi:hypothetical protein
VSVHERFPVPCSAASIPRIYVPPTLGDALEWHLRALVGSFAAAVATLPALLG